MDYDPEIDYVRLHLDFCIAHPNFNKNKYGTVSYIEMVRHIWAKPRKENNETAYKWLLSDLAELHGRSTTAIQSFEKQYKEMNETVSSIFYFVTINFEEESFKSETALEMINSLITKDFVLSLKGVFEYYTETGHHPHFMCKLETLGKVSKGRLAQKIYQTKNIRKLIKGPNFIQVMPFMNYHVDYLDLIKTEDKQDNIQKDYEWRQKMKLPEQIIK